MKAEARGTILSRLFVRQGTVALIDQMVASTSSFATGIIVGRACAVEEFGLYMLGLSIMLVAADLQTSLVSAPYMVFAPRLNGENRKLRAGSAILHQLTLSAVFVVLLLVFLAVVRTTNIGPNGLDTVIAALVISGPLVLLKEFIRRVLFADLMFRTALYIDSIVAVLQVGALLVLTFGGMISAAAAFAVSGLASGAVAMSWFVRRYDGFSPPVSRALTDFVQSWDFGRWIFASGLLWTLSANAYPWLLAAFHGADSTGVWAACFGVVSIGNPILRGLSNLAGPKLAHAYADGGVEKLQKTLIRTDLSFIVAMLPFVLILAVLGDWLLKIIYGSSYSGNGMVVMLLALDLLVTAIRFPISRALFVLERSGIDFAVNIVVVILLVFPGLSLVQSMGAIGAALSLVLGNLAATALKIVAFRKTSRDLAVEITR